MRGLNVAMRERTVEALKAMILECESVELECGEVEEAREMLKMAEFESIARRLRQEKRQMQIEAQWAKAPEPKATAPNVALLEQQAARGGCAAARDGHKGRDALLARALLYAARGWRGPVRGSLGGQCAWLQRCDDEALGEETT